MSNFEFLKNEWNDIYQLVKEAEDYISQFPNQTCANNRKALEKTVAWMYENDYKLRKPYDSSSIYSLICEPCFTNRIPRDLIIKINDVRHIGNRAIHDSQTYKDARKSIESLFYFLYWFYKEYTREPIQEFRFDSTIIPKITPEQAEIEQLKKELERQSNQISEQKETEEQQSEEKTFETSNKDTEEIIALLNQGHNIFVTGEAGTGKSTILKALKRHYKDDLSITSTTGISAIELNGQTIYSWANIGVGVKDQHVKGTMDRLLFKTLNKIRNNNDTFARIKYAKILAIDEISMLSDQTLDFINEVLKIIKNDKRPFGGIQVALFGDFFQLPPADLGENNLDFCFNGKAWEELNIKSFILKNNYRQQKNPEFIKALKKVRIGEFESNDMQIFELHEKECQEIRKHLDSQNVEDNDKILRIFPRNTEADAYNLKCFEEITSEPHTYIAEDCLFRYDKDRKCTDEIFIDDFSYKGLDENEQELYNEFNETCKAPQKLVLKVGARVMLVKNIDLNLGLANGSQGTVTKLNDNSIEVKFDNSRTCTIIEKSFTIEEDSLTKIERIQFPLKLAYGITVHKSQGMTTDKLFVNLENSFACGQVYVALSRTRDLKGLILNNFAPNKIKANHIVKDFYKQIEAEGIYSKEKNEAYQQLKETIAKASPPEEILSTVNNAIFDHKVIEIEYLKYDEGKVSGRYIRPLNIRKSYDKTYIKALSYDDNGENERSFRLDRIITAKIVN